MRRLLTAFIISFFALPSAFADSEQCHIGIKSLRHGAKTGKVTCLHCSNMDDYANFGAALMVDNMDSYTTMYVYNESNAVKVTAATRSNPTFLNYSYFIFSINQQTIDRVNLDVSAELESGRVTGRPWVRHTTSKSHLRATCAVLAETERKWVEENYRQMREARDPSAYYENLNNQNNRGQHFTNAWIRSIENRRARTIVCTSGGTCRVSN